MQRKKKVIVLIVIVLLVVLGMGLDNRLEIEYDTIRSDKLATKLRILLVTDLHSCKYGENQTELIEAVTKILPDVILLGGDIYDDKIPHDNTEKFLDGIADRYPCYYVTGNHEYWSRDMDTILELLQSHQVTVLSGDYKVVEINGQKINICGVSDPDITEYTNSTYGMSNQLETLKEVSDNGFYTILLAHRPEQIALYAQYNYDLVLSGHAHGGQWRLPGIINGLYAPDQGFFPQYTSGEYNVDGTKMIVSRGLARESTRIPRFFNRPELVVIDLEGSTDNEESRRMTNE